MPVFEEFINDCKEITEEIIDLYDELLQFEIKGNKNSATYLCIVDELREKVRQERELYINVYDEIGEFWFSLEEEAYKILFDKIKDKCKNQWFLEQDARYKNMDFKLERRIYGNIYTNIYSFLDEMEEYEDVESVENLYSDENINVKDNFQNQGIDEPVAIVDLSFCKEIEEDYLNTFMYLLKDYIYINKHNLSKEMYESLVAVKYDLAFSTVKWENELLENNFSWPEKVFLTTPLKAFEMSYAITKSTKHNNKSKLFMETYKQYEAMLADPIDLENQIKEIINANNNSLDVQVINFLYLKAIIYANCQSKELLLQKLREYKGINSILDKHIESIVNDKDTDNKIYKLSFFENKPFSK